MKQLQSFLAVLCVWLALAPWTYAQQPAQPAGRQASSTPRLESDNPHWYSRFTRPYEPGVVPPINISNSGRLDSLIRGGNLYLSLQDAIALALENNLDLEVSRYVFRFAENDLYRAKAGYAANGFSGGVTSGVTGGASNLVSGSTGLGVTGGSSSLAGGYDPVLTGNINWGHNTTPVSNSVVSGLTSSVSTNKTANFAISQAFMTGGTATLSYNNNNQFQNSFTNTFNPATNSSLDLTINQPLLQGFGLALNRRSIRVATNNIRAADIVFKAQVNNLVANVIALYWNLVYYNNDLAVKRSNQAVSEKLLGDNRKQVDIGTLAPISIVQAEAEVATAEQAVVQSETNVLQQETTFKSTLSRNGLASPSIAQVHIIPTDPIRVPAVEAIEPIQDQVARAMENRLELQQSRIQLENANINLTGTRNQMLPQVSAVVDLRNNALAGPINTTADPRTGIVPAHPTADPFFIGGYGTILGQLFGRNFPTYTVGVNVTIPLRNRSAQANMITQELNLRNSQISVQKSINQIYVDVQSALTAVTQARAQYQTAVKARQLQEQTFDAEQKKLAVGASTPYSVILTQRDLATAQNNEVSAQAAYAQARNQLDFSTGVTLDRNNVMIDEAKQAKVSRPPTPLPVLGGGGGK